jgi:NADPH2:quinone reductase
MRAVRYHEHGGTDVLQVEEVETPEPGRGEIRIAVEAVGVNPVDTYFREGAYEPPELPMIPGSDLAGIVDAVGEGVEDFAEGDRVFGTGLGNDRQGTCAEQVLAPVDRIARLPRSISFAEGAAGALVGVTAWRALIDHAGLDPAESCLVHGGSGGVGHVAVQLGNAVGATVLTTASETYHDRLRSLGAASVFDYRREDLSAAVADAAGGEREGVDAILDHRLDQYLQFDATVAATGCRVAGIGNTIPEAGFEDVAAARAAELELHLMSMYNTPDMSSVLADLARLMERGDVLPDVAQSYGLDDVAEAQRAVAEDSFFGKLIVEL